MLEEAVRLTQNAAFRREQLLLTGTGKTRKRKLFHTLAGVLALMSAGSITSVVVDLFGDRVLQVLAAVMAATSGTLSLLITSYFSDSDIAAILSGASKYLALREAANRLVVHPNLNDADRFERLVELQREYSELDDTYSRFFSDKRARRAGSLTAD